MEAFAPTYVSRLTWAQKLSQSSGKGFEGLGCSVPIHPIYGRANWGSRRSLSRPKHLLPGGKSGYWEAGNDHVWKILEPCLRLASAFLSSAHVLTRFEAILVGEYNSIEDDIPEEWRGNKLLRFKPRPRRSPERDQLIQKELRRFAGRILFSVESGWTDNLTGMTRPGGFQNGRAFKKGEMIHVEIAFERLIPLLKEEYTMPERQVDVFNTVSTILHESCVSRNLILIFSSAF